MTRWRQRMGEDKLTALIEESLCVALDTGALRLQEVRRVTVDTMVQPKNIDLPTDAKLLYTSIVRLGRFSRACNVTMGQRCIQVASRSSSRPSAMLMPSSSNAIESRSFVYALWLDH